MDVNNTSQDNGNSTFSILDYFRGNPLGSADHNDSNFSILDYFRGNPLGSADHNDSNFSILDYFRGNPLGSADHNDSNFSILDYFRGNPLGSDNHTNSNFSIFEFFGAFPLVADTSSNSLITDDSEELDNLLARDDFSSISKDYADHSNIPSGSNTYSHILSGSNYHTNSTFSILHYFGSDNQTISTFGYLDDSEAGFIIDVVTCIIICISLPLILVAISSLYSLVRNDHVAPIYVINLLISDLIQLCCMICDVARPKSTKIYIINKCIYNYSLMTSVCFMVCIALERYLLIVFPLWYHCRRTIKSSLVICVVAWTVPALYHFTLFFGGNFTIPQIIAIVFLLLPLPLLIFFCCATLKVLSASVSILPEEKRQIVGTLVLMLLIYMLLFLPNAIFIMVERYTNDKSQTNTLVYLSTVFLELNPLADLVLYIFMKKGILDKILASVCCCRVEDKDVNSRYTTTTITV
ncbi:psychosine receptor-like [Perca fluviatilis]|uniref:psychosine receptor-like n=1 Tax=Perca fluviatilis TaxID=8168 RepID=UPI001965BBA7|nr:psychosine receptor-like [Perca fluviatilis]